MVDKTKALTGNDFNNNCKAMLIGWIPFLIYYIYWLRKKQPHRRQMMYEFPLSQFTITLNRW